MGDEQQAQPKTEKELFPITAEARLRSISRRLNEALNEATFWEAAYYTLQGEYQELRKMIKPEEEVPAE